MKIRGGLTAAVACTLLASILAAGFLGFKEREGRQFVPQAVPDSPALQPEKAGGLRTVAVSRPRDLDFDAGGKTLVIGGTLSAQDGSWAREWRELYQDCAQLMEFSVVPTANDAEDVFALSPEQRAPYGTPLAVGMDGEAYRYLLLEDGTVWLLVEAIQDIPRAHPAVFALHLDPQTGDLLHGACTVDTLLAECLVQDDTLYMLGYGRVFQYAYESGEEVWQDFCDLSSVGLFTGEYAKYARYGDEREFVQEPLGGLEVWDNGVSFTCEYKTREVEHQRFTAAELSPESLPGIWQKGDGAVGAGYGQTFRFWHNGTVIYRAAEALGASRLQAMEGRWELEGTTLRIRWIGKYVVEGGEEIGGYASMISDIEGGELVYHPFAQEDVREYPLFGAYGPDSGRLWMGGTQYSYVASAGAIDLERYFWWERIRYSDEMLEKLDGATLEGSGIGERFLTRENGESLLGWQVERCVNYLELGEERLPLSPNVLQLTLRAEQEQEITGTIVSIEDSYGSTGYRWRISGEQLGLLPSPAALEDFDLYADSRLSFTWVERDLLERSTLAVGDSVTVTVDQLYYYYDRDSMDAPAVSFSTSVYPYWRTTVLSGGTGELRMVLPDYIGEEWVTLRGWEFDQGYNLLELPEHLRLPGIEPFFEMSYYHPGQVKLTGAVARIDEDEEGGVIHRLRLDGACLPLLPVPEVIEDFDLFEEIAIRLDRGGADALPAVGDAVCVNVSYIHYYYDPALPDPPFCSLTGNLVP